MDKKRRTFTPTSIFRLLAAGIIIIMSLYSLRKGDILTEVSKNTLNIITQLLFILIFLTAGIEGMKNEDKVKKHLSYFYFSVAIIMAIINTLIFLKVKF